MRVHVDIGVDKQNVFGTSSLERWIVSFLLRHFTRSFTPLDTTFQPPYAVPRSKSPDIAANKQHLQIMT